MRPLIGVTAYVEPARWGTSELLATLVPHRYVQAVLAGGGHPVLLPPEAEQDALMLVDRLDGLLLTGGADIDPARYGAVAHPATTGLRPRRDASELALAQAARSADLPVLGICRGMQVLAVAAGGRLHQHLPDLVGHERHRPGATGFGEHGVRLDPRSRVGEILGESVRVSSHHHQGVADPGRATATGWADDGIVEVIELPGRFAVGVLWHPEVGEDGRLFAALCAAAGEGAAARRAWVRRPGGPAAPHPGPAPAPTPR